MHVLARLTEYFPLTEFFLTITEKYEGRPSDRLHRGWSTLTLSNSHAILSITTCSPPPPSSWLRVCILISFCLLILSLISHAWPCRLAGYEEQVRLLLLCWWWPFLTCRPTRFHICLFRERKHLSALCVFTYKGDARSVPVSVKI